MILLSPTQLKTGIYYFQSDQTDIFLCGKVVGRPMFKKAICCTPKNEFKSLLSH